jgi:hypothetical protein
MAMASKLRHRAAGGFKVQKIKEVPRRPIQMKHKLTINFTDGLSQDVFSVSVYCDKILFSVDENSDTFTASISEIAGVVYMTEE